MNPFRRVAFYFAEREELIAAAIRQHKDIARLTYERDDLAGIVRDLRADLAAAERLRRVLMRACPSDLREMDTIYDQESGAGNG